MFSGNKKASPKQAAPPKAKPAVKKADVAAIKASDIPLQDIKDPSIKSLINWNPGERVPFSFISEMLSKVEAEPGRNAIIDILVKHILAIICTTPMDIIPFTFLLTCTLRPPHEGVVLNVGQSILKNAIAKVSGRSVAQIDTDLKSTDFDGDLGNIAVASHAKQKGLGSFFGQAPKPLTIKDVYDTFLKIAQMTGSGTTERRISSIQKLLSDSKNQEPKYIIRELEGKLRVGVNAPMVHMALGQAFYLRDFLNKKEQPTHEELDEYAKEFRKIYHRRPEIDYLLTQFLTGGFQAARNASSLRPGIPVLPMLAKPAKSTDEIRKRLPDCDLTFEYKYDGERAQIHGFEDGTVQIYARSGRESTRQFEEVGDVVRSHTKAKDFIIDSEVVAMNLEKGIILPFQTLMNRPKLGDQNQSASKPKKETIQVCVFCFDILYLNGEDLTKTPFSERREILYKNFERAPNQFEFATYKNTTLDDVKDFFLEAVENRTEGLMVKTLDSEYEPGKRSKHWAKLKKDYVSEFGGEVNSGLADSVDLVPVGAKIGKGKRIGQYGSFTMAIYDENHGKFQAITEIGTGLSDEQLSSLCEVLKGVVVDQMPKNVDYGEEPPEVFFAPRFVWETKAADITKSAKYVAAKDEFEDDDDDDKRGVSLRFPRFLRVRENKDPTQATTSVQIYEMYKNQAVRSDSTKAGKAAEESGEELVEESGEDSSESE